MDDITVPENLQEQSEEALEQLASDLRTFIRDAGIEQLDDLESAYEALQAVEAEMTRRVEVEARFAEIKSAVEEPVEEETEEEVSEEVVAEAPAEEETPEEDSVDSEVEAEAVEPEQIIKEESSLEAEETTSSDAVEDETPEVEETVDEETSVLEAAEEIVESAAAEIETEEPVAEAPVEETADEPELVGAMDIDESATAELADASAEEAEADHEENEQEKEPTLATASTNQAGAAGLQQHRPESSDPVEDTTTIRESRPSAARGIRGFEAGHEFTDNSELAQALYQALQVKNGASAASREYITVAQVHNEFPDEFTMTNDEKTNFDILRNARRSVSQEAMVASGGICAPFTPSYEFFRLAVPQSPVEQALPVVQAPRGGIRYITPPDFNTARGAVGVTTAEEDRLGYGSTPDNCLPGDIGAGTTADKPCICVACPPVVDCEVSAVSTCVRWGNLQFRTFPEQVEAFMSDLAVAFASEKEILYLDAIAANSTAVTGTAIETNLGAHRQVAHDVIEAAVGYRQRQNMDESSRLTLLAPKWLKGAVDADVVISKHESPRTLAGILADYNVEVVWYNDSATGDSMAFNTAQAAGAINAFPSTAVTFLFAPGTFVRLDAGVLDLGVVRDSTLNKSNDLEMFMEQFTDVCFVGLESIEITHQVAVTGRAPADVGVQPTA